MTLPFRAIVDAGGWFDEKHDETGWISAGAYGAEYLDVVLRIFSDYTCDDTILVTWKNVEGYPQLLANHCL